MHACFAILAVCDHKTTGRGECRIAILLTAQRFFRLFPAEQSPFFYVLGKIVCVILCCVCCGWCCDPVVALFMIAAIKLCLFVEFFCRVGGKHVLF